MDGDRILDLGDGLFFDVAEDTYLYSDFGGD